MLQNLQQGQQAVVEGEVRQEVDENGHIILRMPNGMIVNVNTNQIAFP